MNEFIARLTVFFVILMSARIAVKEIETKPAPRLLLQPRVELTNRAEPEVLPGLQKRFHPERIEQIKKKELRRYKQAQDKKWQNWLEAVSK